MLERRRPKGSRLLVDGADLENSFGSSEGLEVYEWSDVNHVPEEIDRLLGDRGVVDSYREGLEETALHVYGPSFQGMKECLLGFLGSYPLCQKARVVRIA